MKKCFLKVFTAVGSTEDERKIKEMNEGAKDPEQKRLKKKVVKETLKKEDTDKVPTEQDVKEQGIKKRKGGHIKMIARKKLRKKSDVDSDDEHRKCLKIVTFEGTIDSKIMEKKSFISKLDKNKQNELEKYIAFNDQTIDYEILQTKLNDTLGLLALKDIEIKEGLKTKAYEISVLNQKHDELVKKSLLTKSQLEGYLKEKTKNRNQEVLHSNVLKPGMYRIATTTTQNREPQLLHASKNTNPHVSKSTGVNHTTSVSRPQLKCYQDKDKVMPNNIQNPNLNVKNAVCAECGKCVFNSNHDACVSRYLKDVNARTKKPKVVPISASKPKRKANKSVATPHKKTVASDTTIQKSKSYHKELYENTNQEWKWWIAKRCPSGYKWTQKPLRTKKIWMPKIRKEDVSTSISPTIDIVSRITNIFSYEKMEWISFALILGYGDLNQGNVTIKWVYYVEGLNHNLFSVGQLCDADLEVAFRKSTCFV
ncbi:hypothetical protein Tco_0829932 [Tanacetum coccineum]